MTTQQELSENLTNPTLRYLMEWIETVNLYLKDESPFNSIDEYAAQLEIWKKEFCEEQRDLQRHWGDQVIVAVYGTEVILISDQRSGEFIKLTKVGKEVNNV